ncbi:MAG: ATP-binding cassette domain-containing protein [Kiritimatiellae bacterium]|nr:ATP-binding cassette domain-containing protein [Kiritimatiellia bacterium]
MSELLSIEHLSCGYGDRPVLNDVNLTVKEGETVLIAGPNGCGKSTLLKAIIGMLPLTGGDIQFQDRSITSLSTEQRVLSGIGYLRQSNNIFPSQTVAENLMLAGMTLPKPVFDSARAEMLDLFDFLKPKLNQRAGTLSGGQRQALALAMVIMCPQQLYLLDEPSAGLSPKSAQDIIERVRRFAKEDAKRAIVMVEHRLDLLLWIDRAVFLSQGLVQTEPSDSR